MTGQGPKVGDTGTELASPAALDPIAEARRLSGRKHLTPAEARRRYAAILAALAVGGRKQSWVADQIGCSDSNMSRLVRDARRAFATEGATA